MPLSLTSSAFANGGRIPEHFTCDGMDISPPLKWSGVPRGTKCLALLCDDPDAPFGTWTHWMIWDIPVTEGGLPEGVAGMPTLPNGAKQGTNDFGRLGYGGPCPPEGQHRYVFHLYALSEPLECAPGASIRDFKKALKDATIEETTLTGTYKRV
jgi:Raf kinase inhibitor-like YbhB/YbcL family protein